MKGQLYSFSMVTLHHLTLKHSTLNYYLHEKFCQATKNLFLKKNKSYLDFLKIRKGTFDGYYLYRSRA